MSRAITPAADAALNAPGVIYALLAALELDVDPLYLWTGLGDMAWDSRIWLGVGSLLGVEPGEETGEVKAAGSTISLSGVPTEMIGEILGKPVAGREVRCYLALFTEAQALIADPVMIFRGRADAPVIHDSGETASIPLGVESALIDLDRAPNRLYSDAEEKRRFPADRGFEHITDLQDKQFPWGKF